MEWAAGIRTSDRGLVVTIMNKEGVRETTLDALVSGGLPRERSARLVIEQQIQQWTEADPGLYLRAFGLPSNAPQETRQAVYETRGDDTRILVPALVLMRAFLRPTRYLLPEMFLAQALDRVRFLDLSGPIPRVEFLRPTWRNLGDRYGDVSTPIVWMSAFPSAMAFAASVHRHALQGRIAVALPCAKVKMALQGRLKRDTFFATNAELLEIRVTEAPLEWAAAHPRLIYSRATHVPRQQSPVLRVAAFPSRSDGSVDVSEEEWRSIEPILFPPSKSRRLTRLDPRHIFNGILRKLVLGTAWRTTPYVVGSPANALYAYRQWHRSGALQAALSVLQGHRTKEAA